MLLLNPVGSLAPVRYGVGQQLVFCETGKVMKRGDRKLVMLAAFSMHLTFCFKSFVLGVRASRVEKWTMHTYS